MIDHSWYRRPEGIPDGPSAGGVVVRQEAGQALVALAQEKEFEDYVLPKGHIEPGESVEDAALREIEEEVGITDLQLVELLGVRERLSYSKQEWKRTHYFLFTTQQAEGTPTDSERHEQMQWFPLDQLPGIFWPEQKALLEENRDRIVRLLDAGE